ncbi:hypothetical protein [Nostoc sp. FACHB-888]|uniref:hypothetical protein n=1 Tax=Nostoc sp. FACHB-888 TaxID=2692842 RepID=UPI0016848940|nr:hypothetical protein [Nostoc sp. FACHB-888]MBD2244559.1 hypothetical protein [Nostoc sp. FACHB-888]
MPKPLQRVVARLPHKKLTKIEPELLLVYLRSPIVCEILDLHTTNHLTRFVFS